MTSASLNPSISANAADEARIKTIVESVASLADTRNFESLELFFADPVLVDYTSAFGGEPESKSPSELMISWAGLLPGFDCTRHQISNVEAAVDDEEASASAQVVADHYLGNHYWQVTGTYRYRFVKESNLWKISSMTFLLESEVGPRNILTLAAKSSARHPVSYLLRHKTHQVVIHLLKNLEQMDLNAIAELWAEDAIQDMPYSQYGYPKRIVGKDNLLKHYTMWPEMIDKADLTSQLVFYPMVDPEWAFIEFHAVLHIKATGGIYEQKYAALFHVVHGKIKLYRKYFDPTLYAHAFHLDTGAG
jgi:ketosteroid isomerase-like protein